MTEPVTALAPSPSPAAQRQPSSPLAPRETGLPWQILGLAILFLGIAAFLTAPAATLAQDPGRAAAGPRSPEEAEASLNQEERDAMAGTAREKPMDEMALMDFLDTTVHARALAEYCQPFDRKHQGLLYLAYRWGRSVAISSAYSPELMLVAIQARSDYARRLKGIDCAAEKTKDLADSFLPFLDNVPEVVRLSEIR